MTSVQHLRHFIRDRLAAAAEDIFSAFERTIVQYEEKLEHQRTLQEITCSTMVERHRTGVTCCLCPSVPADLPEQRACSQEELCNQERTSSPEQENPEPPRVKEEQEELCSSQEGEPPVLKQEADTVTVTHGESNHSHPEPDCDGLLSNSSDTVAFVDLKSKEILEVINRCVRDDVEIGHQPRVLDHTWNPVVKLYRTDVPQQYVCKQQEDLTDQQERTSSPEQENPEPAQVREEQGGEQLVQMQETDVLQPYLAPPPPPPPVEPITAPFNVSALSAGSHLSLNTITFTGEKLYLCNTCGKIFSTMHSFKRHNTIHTGEKPFVCNTCGRGFRQIYPLTVHMRAHTGELPYVCNTCGKGFKEKVRLRMHVRVHTGEKPHVCSTCGERFKDKAALRRHLKIHTNERPHLCDTCGKTFIEKSALQVHMRTHTGERPYLCNTCGKRYKKITALRLHIRNTRCGPEPPAGKVYLKRKV